MEWRCDVQASIRAFGGSPAPAPAPIIQQAPPAPAPADPAVVQAAKDQATAQAQSAGRLSTILTSGQGDTTTPTIGKQTFLGL